MIQKWDFQTADIPGLLEITPFNADDERGSFTKDYSQEIFGEHGIELALGEIFYSTNKKGVLRGLHFQRVKPQAKLVRCLWGHIWDVVVDLRADSPAFKSWRAFDLYGEAHSEILIPAGCAHGFLALEPSLVCYKCSEIFYPQYDDGIIWNDADIAVPWPLEKIGGTEELIISDKDRNLQSFAQVMARGGVNGTKNT